MLELAIRKEELYKLVEALSNEDKKTALDFMEFLIERSKNKKPNGWKKLDEVGAIDEPLNKEEMEQYESKEGYISGKDGKHEFGIQADLP